MKGKWKKAIALLLSISIIFAMGYIAGAWKRDDIKATDNTDSLPFEETTAAVDSYGSISDEFVSIAIAKAGASAWDGNYTSLTETQKKAVTDYFAGVGYTVELRENSFVNLGPTQATDTTTAVNGEATPAPAVTGSPATVGSTKPSTKAEILAAYSVVMNKAKNEKPAFKQYEYQALPQKNFNSGLVETVMDIALGLMTTEQKAKNNPNILGKGSNMDKFPLFTAPYGCLLTDTNAIKTATFAELANGHYQLTLILKPETNPEPYNPATGNAPNYTGKMFSHFSKKEIDTKIKDSASFIIQSADYTLAYRDCKAVLEYDPATNHVVVLDQTFEIDITTKIVPKIGGNIEGTAVFANTLKVWDVVY